MKNNFFLAYFKKSTLWTWLAHVGLLIFSLNCLQSEVCVSVATLKFRAAAQYCGGTGTKWYLHGIEFSLVNILLLRFLFDVTLFKFITLILQRK